MILEDKHIDSTIVCGLYGCEDNGERVLINCYDDMDPDKGLRFSKQIDHLTNKQTIGIPNNPLTFEKLHPFPLGVHRCNEKRDVLYIISNEWDLFTIAQIRPLQYNMIALVNNIYDYVAISNAFGFIHEFKKVVLISTRKEEKWLYEANKRIQNDEIEVKTVHMNFLEGQDSINEYFIKNGEDKTSVMLAKLMTDLKEISVPGVVDISEVKPENKAHVRKYYTMLDTIDGKTGGLEGGSVWLITGQAGNGKSELVKQISLAIVQQEGKVFYYSGEEKKEKFLNSLHCKVVDEKNIMKIPRKLYGGRLSENDFDYIANPACASRINKWLKGKYFIYDEQFQGNVVNSIREKLEATHKEKGVTVFILDNLMTLTTSVPQQQLNSVQTELMDMLVRFSNDFNVVVILVAHPNKSSELDIQNKDVSGSLNIVNLSSVVISVRRATLKEMEEAEAKGKHVYNSFISCTKDRPTGDTFRMGTDFDRVNKIFTANGNRPVFTWNDNNLYRAMQQVQQEQFPF